jgi:hypothetical protein
MLKYRGQYRVLYEVDKQGKATEFSYIPCRASKGANIYRHNDDTLNAYIASSKTANRIVKENPELFKFFQNGEGEATLLFKESDIDKAAEILKAKTQGKNMNPRPKKKMNLSDEQREKLSARIKTIKSMCKSSE